MAVYEITGPKGEVYQVEGPDDADPSAVIAQITGQKSGPSLADQGKRQLGRTARIVAEGAAYLPLAVADFATGAANLVTGGNRQSPSEGFRNILDSAGLPRAEGGIEKAVDFVGQAAVGMALPTPKLPGPPASIPVRPVDTAKQVIAEGEKRGVPVFFDDVTKNAAAKKVGVAAESVPVFGTGAGRAQQAVAAKDAATKFVDQYVPNTSDDVPELVQKGLQAKLKTFKGTAGKLYERAARELDPLGNVPTVKTDQVIAQEIAGQQSRGTLGNVEVINLLTKYRDAPRGTFSQLRDLRSDLGSDIADFYTGKNAAIGDKGVRALRAMQEALEADMAGFAKQSGGKGYQAWKAADGFYKANLVPFKEAGFRDLVKTAEPEKAWRYLLANGGVKSRSVRMYNSLDDAGRGAVRYGLVKDAMDNGMNPNGSFSPAKFAKYLEDHSDAVNTFFRGRDLQEVKGFQNLMRHVERAGQFAENPPTGNRLATFLLGGAAVLSPQAAAGIAGSGLTVRALFQTETGRNLLLAAGRADPAKMATLASRIERFLAASAGTAAVRNGQPEETPAQAQE